MCEFAVFSPNCEDVLLYFGGCSDWISGTWYTYHELLCLLVGLVIDAHAMRSLDGDSHKPYRPRTHAPSHAGREQRP